jgi:hypothetical protein
MSYLNQVNISYPTIDIKAALKASRSIKDEIDRINYMFVKRWFDIKDHPANYILIPTVVDVLGYSTCSFMTTYDLSRVATISEEGKCSNQYEVLMQNKEQVRHIEETIKGSINGLWQATMYEYVHCRNVTVVPDNSEVDHWAVIYFGTRNVVVASNSIFNLSSAREAFDNPRPIDDTMWLDFHDLAHQLDVTLKDSSIDTIKSLPSGSIFNTPQDLMHIMSADDPKSSFCLFLGLSQGLFDEALSLKGLLDGNIHPQFEDYIVNHIGENIKLYLLGQKSITAVNTSFYQIPDVQFEIQPHEYIRARELALIGEANLGEGNVVWLEQFMFNRGIDKNMSCLEIVELIHQQGELSYKQWRVIFRQMGIIEGIYRAVEELSQPGQRYSWGPESELLALLKVRLQTYRGESSQDLFAPISNGGNFEFASRGGIN